MQLKKKYRDFFFSKCIANPYMTRLQMLHSSLGMFSQLHRMKRDENYTKYCEPNTMARVYATLALQLELCLPEWLSSALSPYVWSKVNKHLNKAPIKHWNHSTCHSQIINMLKARNGFVSDDEDEHCKNTFYSFVLPYITSPLDLVLYWQQLAVLNQQWKSYLDGKDSAFSGEQLQTVLSVSMTTTAPGHMLQWWVLVGLSLESGQHLDTLADYTRENVPSVSQNHPSSNLLRHHQSMVYHLLEASHAGKDADKISNNLKRALRDRKASLECIRQISSTSRDSENDNLEASVLTLSSLAVLVHTYRALNSSKQVLASQLSELRNQIWEDLESPYTKLLSVKHRKHIQTSIEKADETLCI